MQEIKHIDVACLLKACFRTSISLYKTEQRYHKSTQPPKFKNYLLRKHYTEYLQHFL